VNAELEDIVVGRDVSLTVLSSELAAAAAAVPEAHASRM